MFAHRFFSALYYQTPVAGIKDVYWPRFSALLERLCDAFHATSINRLLQYLVNVNYVAEGTCGWTIFERDWWVSGSNVKVTLCPSEVNVT